MERLSFSELVGRRRSIRKFTQELLNEEDVRTIMRAALMAPSSKGLHSYEFLVVDDRERLTALSQCKDMGSAFLSEAPLGVVVMGNPEVGDAWIEDASVASTMILLQAEDLNIGACWIQVRERKDAEGNDAEENVRRTLGIPPHVRVLCIIALGRKGMERKPQNEERLLWDKVHRGQW